MTDNAMVSTGLISSATENQVVADLAQQAAAREVIGTGLDHAMLILSAGQHVHEIDYTSELPNPRRQAGKVTLTDQDSFVEYVNRHRDIERTTLWSDVDRGTVTAVINDHQRDWDGQRNETAGWADHRATLQLKLTEDWRFWAGNDGKLLQQVAFAEHLEEGALNIVSPAAADMLEIAQSFQAKRGVAFKSSIRLKDGDVGLQYEETTEARSGVKGSIEIPDTFTLRLQPFEGGPEYADVVARLRYRINDGTLLLGYKITRPDLVKRAAFNEITSTVSEGIGLPVMAGTPRN